MRNLWVRFGCFLTGYNYHILRGCSEAAFKSVKKYTAAMVIVCILWFFIGFTFAGRYLSSGMAGCVLAGVIAVVIIVQVERQIILSINPGKPLLIFRGCLAFMMAILGAVIIDQTLLEKDIDLEKISYITERVNKILPDKTAELRSQITELDSTIKFKNTERDSHTEDCNKHPLIYVLATQSQVSYTRTRHVNASGQDSFATSPTHTNTVTRTSVPNPRLAMIPPLDSAIGALHQQKAVKQNDLLHIRPALENEMKAKTGFLDELKVMVRLISSSYVALCFWLLWILFFLFIELLVLSCKLGSEPDDYQKAVLHHMNLQIRRLEIMARDLQPEQPGRLQTGRA